MDEKLKAYCEEQLWSAKCLSRNNDDIRAAMDRCYGAVMFTLNYIKDEYDTALGDWWSYEIYPQFRKLLIDKQ